MFLTFTYVLLHLDSILSQTAIQHPTLFRQDLTVFFFNEEEDRGCMRLTENGYG